MIKTKDIAWVAGIYEGEGTEGKATRKARPVE